MSQVVTAFAKLAGTLKAAQALLRLQWRPGQPHAHLYENFDPADAQPCFDGAAKQLEVLRIALPDLYGDFPAIKVAPTLEMADGEYIFARTQIDGLVRSIDQIFEIRANSELATPEVNPSGPCVFISHGRAPDWREVQAFIEKDLEYQTIELAQQPNLGRTILEKLEQESRKCNSAVIVMTGDDKDAEGQARTRENVMHEIGYFQGKFGLSRICLLHEEGTNIPSNIHGLVYSGFTKGNVQMAFGLLMRELKAFYKNPP